MRLIKYTSKRLIGNSAMAEYERALEALKEAAAKVDSEVELQVSLVDKTEVYSKVNQAVKDIRNLEFMYSHRALQRDPKLAIEYSEVASAVLAVTKITTARRREDAKFRSERNKRNERRVEKKPSENKPVDVVAPATEQ